MANVKQNKRNTDNTNEDAVREEISQLESRLERKISHSNLFGLVASVCGIVSLMFSFYFNNLQDKKWDSLNQARIDVTDCKFIAFAEMDYNTISSKEWLGKHSAYHIIDNGLATQKYRIYNHICFWDKLKGSQIHGTKLMLTKEDVDNEIKRLDLQEKLNKGLIEVMKRYQMEFKLKNVGQLPAKNVGINIDMILPDGSKANIVKTMRIAEITNSHEFNATGSLYTPLDASLPPQVPYVINLNYITHEQFQSRTIKVKYDTESNFFLWEE